MQTTTAEHLDAEAERTAGILEDRHEHETTACTGHRYFVNEDFPDEGTDIHHDGPCPAHLEGGGPGIHPTVEARPLADAVVALFGQDSRGHWKRVVESLERSPGVLDSIAAEHGLPRPTDAVKLAAIALVRSQGLAEAMSIIPPAGDRPVCVRVGWLAEHPGFAAQLVYHEADTGEWRPAAHAVRSIDPGWPVEVRQAMTVVGA